MVLCSPACLLFPSHVLTVRARNPPPPLCSVLSRFTATLNTMSPDLHQIFLASILRRMNLKLLRDSWGRNAHLRMHRIRERQRARGRQGARPPLENEGELLEEQGEEEEEGAQFDEVMEEEEENM